MLSKSGSFALVLTAICLSVLMSLEADAQSTTDETNSCSSSSLEEVVNLVKIIASNQHKKSIEIKKITVVKVATRQSRSIPLCHSRQTVMVPVRGDPKPQPFTKIQLLQSKRNKINSNVCLCVNCNFSSALGVAPDSPPELYSPDPTRNCCLLVFISLATALAAVSDIDIVTVSFITMTFVTCLQSSLCYNIVSFSCNYEYCSTRYVCLFFI